MLHPGQREPMEAEIKKTGRDTGTASRDQWRYDMPYCLVGVFLPRDISDFLWERDEEPYPHGSLRGYRHPQRRRRDG